LTSAISATIARDRSMYMLLDHAPAGQRQPVLLLAAIHDALLLEPTHPLARWYPTITSTPAPHSDPELADVLGDFVHDRLPSLLHTLETRRVQTNEIGRCALFLPAFSIVSAEVGPLHHVDVGTSAGLTTLLPHYSYRYDGTAIIGTGTPLIECGTRGSGPVPEAIPVMTGAIGIDRAPLDAASATDARWLLACCWPDQADRFGRLTDALAVARDHPPQIVVGDAVERVRDVCESASDGHPIVTTSWVLNYLAPSQRLAFMSELDAVGSSTDLSWVIAESPAQTPELHHPAELAGEHITALTVVRWRRGVRTTQALATCHPHGYWIHWRT
jgi:hypothetical protein